VTTKQRFRNKYRLEVRERDQGPAHVHLVGGNVDVVINLNTLTANGPWPRGLKEEVMPWVAAHRDDLLEEWQGWYP
jgi:hypothetical protein